MNPEESQMKKMCVMFVAELGNYTNTEKTFPQFLAIKQCKIYSNNILLSLARTVKLGGGPPPVR